LAREEKYQKGREKSAADMDDLIGDREAKQQVMGLVTQLGETCKKILVMFYYENASIKDMLEVLDYENEQVVRNKKYKCMKQLEEIIAGNPALKQTLKTLLHG
jgi:DNA-directed RNA polymerase specialized sigma subunit